MRAKVVSVAIDPTAPQYGTLTGTGCVIAKILTPALPFIGLDMVKTSELLLPASHIPVLVAFTTSALHHSVSRDYCTATVAQGGEEEGGANEGCVGLKGVFGALRQATVLVIEDQSEGPGVE
ncbi:hypothetical protein ABVT39_015185 [Epinephelus coioides]